MIACANCGNQNLPGLKFCTSCGQPLVAAPPAPPAAVVGRSCPSCGASIPEAVKFCIKCGKPLSGEAPHPPVAAPPPPPPFAPPAPIVAGPPAPSQAAFVAPPGPPPVPRKSAAGTIVAAVIVLAALGAGGYYGYSRWKAKEAPPQTAAVPAQPSPADQVPRAHAEPAVPPPAGAPPAEVQPDQKSAAAASPVRPPAKPGNIPAANLSKKQVPSRPAQRHENELAPLHQAPPPAVPAAPPEASPSPRPISVGGNVQAALLIRQTPPVYPPLAERTGISGVVRLRVVVGTDGAVKEVSVISGNPLLTQAATDAVRQWLYRPTVVNGQPTEVVTEAAITFRLRGQ